MAKQPVISIIIPVYNAAKYLRECLDSVLHQTYNDWDCIIVNDGSTDNSQEIIDEYCHIDDRFVSYIKQNEKSAAIARRFGAEHSKSEWIFALDADDAIELSFLEKLISRQKETDADCVTGYLIRCKSQLYGELWRIPDVNFDINVILSGREACLLTLGGWRLSGSGIIRRTILLQITPGMYLNSDEYNQRQYLLNVEKYAMTDAKYFYRNNIGTSECISVRMFDRTLVDMQLEQFVYDNFPEREDKIIALAWQRLFNLIYLTADYNIHKNEFTKEEQEKAYEILRKSYRALNRKTARKAAPIQSLMLTHSFTLFSMLATLYVKYKRNHGGNFYYR